MKRNFLFLFFLFVSIISAQTYSVKSYTKINELHGGFKGKLDNQDFFGISVAYIGDLDGNGFDDLVVGAFGDDDGGSDKGAVWVLFLDDDNNVVNETKISDTTGGFNGVIDNNDIFGDGLAYLGDLNNDGLIEIAVGAAYDGDGGTWHGAIWILSLNNDGTVNRSSKISDTEGGFTGFINGDAVFGCDIENIGDLNNDGIDDLAVGSRRDADGGSTRGAVWILFMNNDFTVNSFQKISDTQGGFTASLQFEDFFGGSVTNVGDLDSDGNTDIIVSSYRDDDLLTNSGSFYVLFLNSDGTVKRHQKVSNTLGGLNIEISQNALFGRSIDGVLDIDGDGKIEIVVGALRQINPTLSIPTGAFFIIEINSDGTVSEEYLYTYAENCFGGELNRDDFFGGSVSVLEKNSDVSIAVGAYRDSENGSQRGAIWILNLGEVVYQSTKENPKDCGVDNGTITISGLNTNVGYTITYSYESASVSVTQSSDGSGVIELTGLATGVYDSIVVTENSTGCTDNLGEIELAAPSLVATIDSTNPTDCGLDDGTITISGLNTNVDYVISYSHESASVSVTQSSDGSGVIELTGLATGVYDSIVVTENSTGCTDNLGQIELAAPSLVATIDSTNPTDCGLDDGTITISGLNTNVDYVISYSHESASVSVTQSSDGSGVIELTGLATGVYDSIVVTENSTGCTDNLGQIELAAPSLVATIDSTNPTDCGLDDGTITISGLNTNVDYVISYSHESAPVSVTQSSDGSGVIELMGLATGVYDSIVVTENSTGCTDNLGQIELAAPSLVATIDSTNPTDCGLDDGTITISGLNTNVDYVISYSHESAPVSVTEFSDGSGVIELMGLTTGIYDSIIVTEVATNCQNIFSVRELFCQNDNLTCFKTKKFFTPNGDGFNDFWKLEIQSNSCDYFVFIYNRYGKLLKTLSPSNDKWNGLFNGKKMPSGDYWYLIKYDLNGNGEKSLRYSSHFTLKR